MAAQRIRVVHLIETFALGGAEVLLAEALPRLSSEFDLRIIALSPPDVLSNNFRQNGVAATLLTDRSVTSRDWISLAGAFRRELDRQPADIVHTHLFAPTIIARLTRLAFAGGPRLITTLHNPDYSNLEMPSRARSVMRRVIDWASGLAANNQFVAVSQAVARDFRKHLGARGSWGEMNVIYNALDIERMVQAVDHIDREAARRAYGWAPEEIGVLSIGRLTYQKNYPTLISAVESVRAKGVKVRAVVLGDGPDRDALVAASGDAVEFRGGASREHVIAALAACDIYAQPSRYEAFGIAILEGMCAQRPVVATAVDGIPEVVADNETGLLTPEHDTQAFADALLRLARDADLRRRFGAAGRARARAKFDVSRWAAETGALYRRVAARD
jgi:glycosyltransferase involved in cell wall biosynthesis